jgi:Prenyltransferase and squalene oxidase repeat
MSATVDDVAILLLADSSPSLRRRVLVELLDVPVDYDEVTELTAQVASDPAIVALLADETTELRQLSFNLCRLAYAGLAHDHPRVAELAEAVLAHQQPDGSFPLSAFVGSRPRYDMVPLQTALPLRGLAAVGYAEDPRAERAYDWLLARRLPDGSWPTARAAGQAGYVAGYRRLPAAAGCRTNTTGALACLALHPSRATSDEARTALDLLLQRETRDEWALGAEIARLVGVEPPAGFMTFYARFDLAFLLELATRSGAAEDDPRLSDLIAFLESRRGRSGLWEHPSHPELSRWLTFDILLSLRRVVQGDWVGAAFRTSFRAYPRRRRRY